MEGFEEEFEVEFPWEVADLGRFITPICCLTVGSGDFGGWGDWEGGGGGGTTGFSRLILPFDVGVGELFDCVPKNVPIF